MNVWTGVIKNYLNRTGFDLCAPMIYAPMEAKQAFPGSLRSTDSISLRFSNGFSRLDVPVSSILPPQIQVAEVMKETNSYQ